ncbi:MAG TPA: DOMON-like domain-containing protein [Allosphingosinicella sp.]|nr:DOMON-like domain-containing protein [Allosphingosinicella sp.]
MKRLLPNGSSPAPNLMLAATAEREGTELLLRFELSGIVSGLVLPPRPAKPMRRDELWRETCFEAFVRPSGSEAYHEINIAPSGDWALYHFTDRRSGMTSPDVPAPAVEVETAGDRLVLRTAVELAGLLSPAVPWQLNLTAVLRTEDANSYWALAHPPEGPPDFHHPACFVLELPPPGAT